MYILNFDCTLWHRNLTKSGINGFVLQVKEEECGTLEVAQAIQSTSVSLQKAKDIYIQRGLELDKLKKDNASAKELEKSEIKLKKAQEDYKLQVDKYATIKEDFEKRMSLACQVRSCCYKLEPMCCEFKKY